MENALASRLRDLLSEVIAEKDLVTLAKTLTLSQLARLTFLHAELSGEKYYAKKLLITVCREGWVIGRSVSEISAIMRMSKTQIRENVRDLRKDKEKLNDATCID